MPPHPMLHPGLQLLQPPPPPPPPPPQQQQQQPQQQQFDMGVHGAFRFMMPTMALLMAPSQGMAPWQSGALNPMQITSLMDATADAVVTKLLQHSAVAHLVDSSSGATQLALPAPAAGRAGGSGAGGNPITGTAGGAGAKLPKMGNLATFSGAWQWYTCSRIDGPSYKDREEAGDTAWRGGNGGSNRKRWFEFNRSFEIIKAHARSMAKSSADPSPKL